MKIFYIVTNPISPVIESQVIERVISLQNSGVDVQVLFLLQSQHYLEYLKGKSQKSELLKEIKVKFFPTIGRESKFGSIWMMTILLSQIFKYKNDKVILHCRGLGAMSSALLTKSFLSNKIRVIYDIRGDSLSEKIFYKSSKSILDNIQKKELKALKNSDKILVVSNKLRDTLQERYKYKFSAEVFYCVAKYEIFHFQEGYRERLRKELNLENKFVFVYSGNLNRWHNFDKILELIKSVSIERENTHLLLLTRDTKLGLKKIREYKIENRTTLLSVEYKNISHYLSVADASLLFRDKDPLNIVASPTKFAEYSLNGLGTIITDSIGDYSKMLDESGYGLCLDSSQNIKEHTQQVCKYIDNSDSKKTDLREKQGMLFKDKLSIENTINKLINIYKKL